MISDRKALELLRALEQLARRVLDPEGDLTTADVHREIATWPIAPLEREGLSQHFEDRVRARRREKEQAEAEAAKEEIDHG